MKPHLALLLICANEATAQVPILDWGHAFTGPGNASNYINTLRGVTTGPDGAVYAVGHFANNLDMDPGPGTTMLTTAAQTDFDMLLAKYDSSGALVWAKQLITASNAFPDFIERQPGGDLIIGGYMIDSVDFDPGPGQLNVGGVSDFFFARYDPDGNVVWAKTFGSFSGIDEMHALEVDAAGNIWIAGAINDSIDMDPGPGVAMFHPTPASRDGLIAKFDPDGNYQWGHVFGNTWNDEAKAIAFDASGNAVVTGLFRTSVDMDPSAGVYTLDQLGTGDDVVVARFTTNGTLIDAFAFGASANTVEPSAIAVDANGDLVLCGEFYGGMASLEPGQTNGTINIGGYMWGWIAKYSTAPALLWSNVFSTGQSGGPNFQNLVLDADGDVVVGGSHLDNFDADPGPGTVYMWTNGAYLLQYNGADGAFEWESQLGSSVSNYFEGLHIDPDDTKYVAGGNGNWSMNGTSIGQGNAAILLKTGACDPPQIISEPGAPSDFCEQSTMTLDVGAIGSGLTYQWFIDSLPSGTNADTLTFGPIAPGTYSIHCVVNGLCGTDTTGQIVIGVGDSPEPTIVESAGLLFATGVGMIYHWYLDGNLVWIGSTPDFSPTSNGTYTVYVLGFEGCFGMSPPFYYGGIGINEHGKHNLRIIHTPGAETFVVQHASLGSQVRLLDATGREIRRWRTTSANDLFNIECIAAGLHLIVVGDAVQRIFN
ncbi:MAG: hypothetical protein IPJ76_03405 [Flavobacteriales bacterium]|nr:MAG: hypothetical protein IPJ76_03405 [Flavobacteriales bacterium]